jgi:hypothetical protein
MIPKSLGTILRQPLVRKLANAIAVASVLVVAPFLAFSETVLKSILDRWLSQCTVVLEVTQDGAEPPLVRLYSFGDMPDALPLTFSSASGVIERVSLLNHVEQETISSEPNVLVHPLANQRCPGDLCPDTAVASEKLTVRVRPITPNYVYQFRVILSKPSANSHIKVYAKPLLQEKIGCRVETANLSNYFARQPRLQQLLLLFVFVVGLTLIVNYLRSRSGE